MGGGDGDGGVHTICGWDTFPFLYQVVSFLPTTSMTKKTAMPAWSAAFHLLCFHINLTVKTRAFSPYHICYYLFPLLEDSLLVED